MNDHDRGHVRPTKRCLDDLGLRFPPYTHPLGAMDHPLVRRAQSVPEEVAAGGAERVRSLTDRIWFKAKVSTFRGAVTRLGSTEAESLALPAVIGEWWIGAAGRRESGSRDDFYESLEAEATRSGRGTGGATSAHLLPVDVDRSRLEAETAALAVRAVQHLVRQGIVMSLRNAKAFSVQFDKQRVTAYVRAENGTEAYLAVGAMGFWDPKFLAIILASVPGVAAADWQMEPSSVLGIQPEPGQLIWSTLIPPDVQAQLLDLTPDEGEPAIIRQRPVPLPTTPAAPGSEAGQLISDLRDEENT